MIDDESTDDELGVNLQLAQKLQINMAQCQNRIKHPRKCTKEYKQFYNEKKKELHDDGLTANIFPNTELPVQGGWFVAETPSPYHLGNKKRQNGDRSNVGGAKSKRTCLSEKIFEGLGNANGNKGHVNELPLTSIQKRYSKEVENNAGHSKKVAITGAKKYFKSVRSNHECSPKDISPDETYENHLASKTPFYSGKPNLIKAKNDYRKCEKKIFERPVSDGLSFPSTSKVEHTDLANFPGSNRSKPVHRGVQFIDSDSDDENMCLKQGVLKGGGQTNYGLYRSRRKAHRILDTDDSDDSNWIYNYRNCHSGFSPSDSNGSNEGIKSLHLEASSNCNDHCSSAEQSKQSSSSNSTDSLTALARNISFSKAGSNSSECESRCNGDTLGTLTRKSKNFCKQNRKKLSRNEIPTKKRVHQFHDSNSQNTSLARLRRRQKSPHRCVSSHTRSLRCKKNVVEHPHTSPSSSSKLSSDEQNDLSLTARFPDVFDAEEYFTANSSSVTESSNESSVAWGVSVTSTLRKNGAGAALGYANVGDSSENEISVIFSSNPPHTEENVIQLRGSVRNKRSACGHEHSLDVVSLSPDPVELVRQMEDDERLARSLQAQFDAEANGSEEPNSQISHSPLSSEENDIIDSVDGLNIRRLPSQIDVVRPNHGSARSRHFSRGRRRGRQRGGSRHSAHIPDVLSLRNIPGVRILDSPDDPWTWQFARMLGLGTTLSTGIDSDFDDYEVLLEIAEDIGEVIQRGLHKTEVNRLPTRQYTNPNTARGLEEVSHKRTDLNKECQVCLCDYEHGDVLRILPCFHEFHIPCIDPWLKINRTCPVCRVVVNFGE